MAEETSANTTPTRRRPPAWMNRILSGLLRSPLHGLLSKEMMLITFTGRKSGKQFTTPVTMLPDGKGVKFFTSNPWYKNLVGGAPVTLLIAGRERAGYATVEEDSAVLLRETKAFLAERGLKNAFRIGLELDANSPPSDSDLANMLAGRALIAVSLS
jgi:hypothetical protein